MAKYKITEKQQLIGTRTWRYEVEANTEKEALEKVWNGNVEPQSCTDDIDDDNSEVTFEVEDAE